MSVPPARDSEQEDLFKSCIGIGIEEDKKKEHVTVWGQAGIPTVRVGTSSINLSAATTATTSGTTVNLTDKTQAAVGSHSNAMATDNTATATAATVSLTEQTKISLASSGNELGESLPVSLTDQSTLNAIPSSSIQHLGVSAFTSPPTGTSAGQSLAATASLNLVGGSTNPQLTAGTDTLNLVGGATTVALTAAHQENAATANFTSPLGRPTENASAFNLVGGSTTVQHASLNVGGPMDPADRSKMTLSALASSDQKYSMHESILATATVPPAQTLLQAESSAFGDFDLTSPTKNAVSAAAIGNRDALPLLNNNRTANVDTFGLRSLPGGGGITVSPDGGWVLGGGMPLMGGSVASLPARSLDFSRLAPATQSSIQRAECSIAEVLEKLSTRVATAAEADDVASLMQALDAMTKALDIIAQLNNRIGAR